MEGVISAWYPTDRGSINKYGYIQRTLPVSEARSLARIEHHCFDAEEATDCLEALREWRGLKVRFRFGGKDGAGRWRATSLSLASTPLEKGVKLEKRSVGEVAGVADALPKKKAAGAAPAPAPAPAAASASPAAAAAPAPAAAGPGGAAGGADADAAPPKAAKAAKAVASAATAAPEPAVGDVASPRAVKAADSAAGSPHAAAGTMGAREMVTDLIQKAMHKLGGEGTLPEVIAKIHASKKLRERCRELDALSEDVWQHVAPRLIKEMCDWTGDKRALEGCPPGLASKVFRLKEV